MRELIFTKDFEDRLTTTIEQYLDEIQYMSADLCLFMKLHEVKKAKLCLKLLLEELALGYSEAQHLQKHSLRGRRITCHDVNIIVFIPRHILDFPGTLQT